MDSNVGKEVLQYLFIEYEKDANRDYDIAPMVKRKGLDPIEVANNLYSTGFIKQPTLGIRVMCGITLFGITRVKPEYVHQRAMQILHELASGGSGNGDIIEILGYGSNEYIKAMEIAEDMKYRALIDFGFRTASENSLQVSLTQKGWDLARGLKY